MFDVERLLGQMLSGGVSKATRGRSDSFGSGLGAGLGSINGGIGGGLSKGALGVGALGIAWAAFEHFKDKGAETAAAAPPPLPVAAMPPPFMGSNPGASLSIAAPAVAQFPNAEPVAVLMPVQAAQQTATPGQREADAAHLIRAMISAANADGQIDMQERSQILERAMSAGLSVETQKFLLAELSAPAGLAQIIAATRDGLQREVYAASMLSITADTMAEQAHLNSLAIGLHLDDAALAQISASVGPR